MTQSKLSVSGGWETRRKLVGIEESSALRIWAALVVLGGLVCNFVVLVGCMSPATEGQYLYRVSKSDLAQSLQVLSNNGTGNITELQDPALPDYWQFGMSGICDVYKVPRRVQCRHAFPPVSSLHAVIEASLRRELEGDTFGEQYIQTVLTTYQETLSGINDTVLPNNETQLTALGHASRGSAALAILSLFLAAAILTMTILSLTSTWFMETPRLWKLYLLCAADAALFLGSGLLAKDAASNSEFQGIIDAAAASQGNLGLSSAGPALAVLLAGAFVKLLAIGAVAVITAVVGLSVVIFAYFIFFVVCCESDRKEVYHHHHYV